MVFHRWLAGQFCIVFHRWLDSLRRMNTRFWTVCMVFPIKAAVLSMGGVLGKTIQTVQKSVIERLQLSSRTVATVQPIEELSSRLKKEKMWAS